jgi:glycosyltransferase involved in cell wall biosynthesis
VSDVTVAVLIPAFNEEQAIGRVVSALGNTCADRVLVVDNGSTDDTARVAREAGATVVAESEKGYGAACLRGIAHYRAEPPDVLVFIDGDFSDFPEDLDRLVAPIESGEAEMVIGSRVLGGANRKALLPQARFGNWLACRLIKRFFGAHYTDLGPFRAIRWETLERLGMRDRDYGWTVEMQVVAAKLDVPSCEVPVSYRRRIGRSKISGTLIGSVRAGQKILWTIFRERMVRR